MSNERLIKAFEAIKSFVLDLKNAFPSEKTILSYAKILATIDKDNEVSMKAVTNGFNEFFILHHLHVLNNELGKVPRGTKIPYGRGVINLEIQKFFHLSRNDQETREAIRNHLIAIRAILCPDDDEALKALEEKLKEAKIDNNSNEGKFISGFLAKAHTNLQGASTPFEALGKLFTGGTLEEMMKGMTSGVDNKELNPKALFKTMRTVLDTMMPPEDEDGKKD